MGILGVSDLWQPELLLESGVVGWSREVGDQVIIGVRPSQLVKQGRFQENCRLG